MNPVRADLAKTPETSNHTSIQYRINAARAGKEAKRLMPFAGNIRENMPHVLPFVLTDYLELVDITGRQFARNKRGLIESTLPGILTRLNINVIQWSELTTSFEQCFHQSAGNEASLAIHQKRHNLQRVRGRTSARRLFG